jgi:hypothetical protein
VNLVGPETSDVVIRLHLLRQGSSLPGDDLVFQDTAHLTITPNGDVTVNFDRFSITCS